MSINRAILLGHVGGDAEIRSMTNGDRVATFSLATSERWRNKTTGQMDEATEWHRVVVFNQALVEICDKYVRKGGRVAVEGMIKSQKYTDRDGVERRKTEIVVGRFDGRLSLEGQPQGGGRDEHAYGERKPGQGHGSAQERNPDDPRAPAPQPARRAIDDDIPF